MEGQWQPRHSHPPLTGIEVPLPQRFQQAEPRREGHHTPFAYPIPQTVFSQKIQGEGGGDNSDFRDGSGIHRSSL